MKGKIVYTTVVEKEIEIPDELVNMQTNWFLLTDEEREKREQLSESIWGEIPWDNRCGMYYEKDGHDWIIEEY